jgi:hypothetical protein
MYRLDLAKAQREADAYEASVRAVIERALHDVALPAPTATLESWTALFVALPRLQSDEDNRAWARRIRDPARLKRIRKASAALRAALDDLWTLERCDAETMLEILDRAERYPEIAERPPKPSTTWARYAWSALPRDIRRLRGARAAFARCFACLLERYADPAHHRPPESLEVILHDVSDIRNDVSYIRKLNDPDENAVDF